MGDIYNPTEQQVEVSEVSVTEQTSAMETRVTEAQSASPTTSLDSAPMSDNAELQASVPTDNVNPTLEMESKVDGAASVGDNTNDAGKVKDVTAIEGQMTDTPQYNQGNNPDCLLQSTRMAEAKQTGVDPGVDVYKDEAIRRGNYSENGVNMERFTDQINERPGLQAEMRHDQSLDDIKSELDQQHSVIVGVDAGTLYDFPPDGSGHALVVTGATQDAAGNWNVTVNDPNEFSTNKSVSEAVFKQAWDLAGNRMIVMQKA